MNNRQSAIAIQSTLKTFQKFTLDSRPTGAGKTTGKSNSIYSRITDFINQNQSVIIVVPSIKLQEAYQTTFPNIVIVNKTEESSAYSKFTKALKLQTKIICVTSKFFRDLSTDEDITSYHLIIDEAFTPHDIIPVDNRNTGKMSAINTDGGEDVLKSTFAIVKQLTIDIVLGYKSVHIAAAALEVTFLYYWLTSNNINFTFTGNFTKHTGPKLHCANLEATWSMQKQKDARESSAFDYVAANRKAIGELNVPTLYYGNTTNDNKPSNSIFAYYSDLNSAGSNEYMHCVKVVCEQAINPNPAVAMQLKQMYNMNDYELHRAYSTYDMYQNIGRTAIRIGKAVDAYLMSLIDTTILNNDFYHTNDIDMYELESLPQKEVRKVRSDKGTKVKSVEEKKAAKSIANAKARAKKLIEKGL